MKTRIIAVLIVGSLFSSSVPLAMTLSAGVAPHSSRQRVSTAPDHSCCPGSHLTLPVQLVLEPQAPMPCGEQHPCCVRPGRENPASLPATTSSSIPFQQVAVAVLERSQPTVLSAALSFDTPFSPPYSQRSTVLRI